MSDVKLKIPNLAGGAKYNVDPPLLPDNALADAQNLLPRGALGGAEKIKVWHKDLLSVGDTGADDRIWTGATEIENDSAALELADPFLPRFDDIESVFCFYSNCFDDGATNFVNPCPAPNVPLTVDTDTNFWTPTYTFYTPTTTAVIKAGFLLSKDVTLVADKPLHISVPVRQNGTYSQVTHEAVCDLYYIDGTQPNVTSLGISTVELGDLGLGRMDFALAPLSDREVLRAGEYYIEITQGSTTTPLVYGYSFLGPTAYATGSNANLFGWAELPSDLVTGEAIADAAIVLYDTTPTVINIYQTGHTFANDNIILATFAFKGTSKWTAFINANTTGYPMTVDANLTAQTATVTAVAWDIATAYPNIGSIVSHGGSLYHAKSGMLAGEEPGVHADWQLFTAAVTYSATATTARRGLPILTLTGNTADLIYGTRDDAGTAVTAEYNYLNRFPLAELMVYQKTTEGPTFATSATELYIGSRFTAKNAGMPAAAVVRTDEAMPIYALSDRHALFMLYQTATKEDTVADGLMVGGAMFNTFDQFCSWYSPAGVQSVFPIYYYLPKFIGEIRCFVNYQNRMIFGGVGGLAIFDPKNLLESTAKGKVYTPWSDIVVPNIEQRLDSQYLTDAAITPVDVHPPTIRDLMVYGDDPGRVFALSNKYVFWSGGTVGGVASTLQNVWLWNALAVFVPGDTQDQAEKLIFFDQRGLIATENGDLYELSGTPPTDPAVSFGSSFQVHKIRTIGRVKHWINTELGYLIFCDENGTFYKLTGSLVPEPWGDAFTVDYASGRPINRNITGMRWDRFTRRLWIATDGNVSRAYMDGPLVELVEDSPRSYVWDADTDSFWPVVNPLDEADRTDLPTVFRSEKVSWSAGCFFDFSTQMYTFTAECDIAGIDPLPFYNNDESLYQPENSELHATESTAFGVTKAMIADDHAQTVVWLQSLARFVDASDCTLSVVSAGVETSLGAFSGTTDFATLAHKITSLRPYHPPRVNDFQIKFTITNAYADVIRNFEIHADLAGWLV
jgi:hypothetical protein